MKRIAAIVRTAVCVLPLFVTPLSFAQNPDPAMRAALEHLTASQNLGENLPLLLRNIASNGPGKVLQGAYDTIDANPALNPAQRARAKETMAALAPQIAADLDAMQAKIDLKALMLAMVEAVYPKYYSLREIQEMATFYDSPASRKALTMGVQAKAEISRTGMNPALVWARYEARFTPEEKRFLAAFQNSPTARKMRSVGPQVQEDSLRYLHARTDGLLDEVMARYKGRLEKATMPDPAS